MSRRVLPVICVAFLALAAGCTGIFGGGGGGGSGTVTTTATPPGTTATTQTTTATTSLPPTETPSPAAAVVADHRKRLDEAESFLATYDVDVSGPGARAPSFTYRYRVDVGDDRQYASLNLSRAGQSVTAETYTAGDRTYQRIERGGAPPEFRSVSAPYDGEVSPVNLSRATAEFLVSKFGAIDLGEAGTGTFEGRSLRKFTASGVDAWDLPPPDAMVSLTDFEMTVLVDQRGVVRVVDYTINGTSQAGEAVSQHVRVEITDLGQVDVAPPDWIDEAKGSN